MPVLLLVLLLALLAPAGVVAQGLPAFAPINPVAAGRTPLSYEPYRPYRPGSWALTAALSYASTIETNNIPTATYLLDSELLRVRFGVSRDLSPRTFVLADAELLGAYSGFLDGFLDWYHGLLGINIPERDRRPHDQFGYFVDLHNEAPLRGRPDDAFLGDARLGVGVRVHPAVQSVAVVTLPTSTGPEGYGRGVVTAGLLNTAHLTVSSRLAGEGSLGFGFAPSHGTLAESQHELLASGSARGPVPALRPPVALRQPLLPHPYYHDTAMPSLDRYDLALDFGVLLGSDPGHEWRIGMTEDLKPSGPAVDLIFQFGGKF